MARAVRQLEDLDEELHVDQPAGAELQVNASRPFPPELPLHPEPDVVDLGALRVREPGTEDARPPEGHEAACEPGVAQDRPGADERLPLYQLLPLLAHCVLFGGSYSGGVSSALRALGA